jgi:hypothetical protein
MSDDYDVRLKQVQERNDFILGHFVHVWRGRVSDETLYQHVLNIQGFTDHYLNYSAETDELRSGDQITSWDVYDFVTDWLPRKCWVTSGAVENHSSGIQEGNTGTTALAVLYAYLYELMREELAYILDIFPIVRRKDEEMYGEYQTKRMILEN